MHISTNKLFNKRILIIGGTGSLGKALIQKLSKDNDLHIMSRDEAKHWTIRNNLDSVARVTLYVGDIRDYERVVEVILSTIPEIIIIASALKQVDTCENTPDESIKTNLQGVQNVCKAVVSNSMRLKDLGTVLLVSTDKACAPTNVYGMSKALAERVVTSYHLWNPKIKFVVVRYGNVLESRGSIIPLFKHQVEANENLTVTDKRMTRFIMTLNQSIELIEETIANSHSGEIWIPKIAAMKIIDLAEIFSDRFGGKIRITGMRPGEKLHEDLVSEPESIRVQKLKAHYVIENSTNPIKTNKNSELFSYSSDQELLSKETLESYLHNLGIFEMDVKEFLGREIEEIRGRLK